MSVTGLNIAAKGEFDLLSLGAMVHRLDPGIIPFRKAAQCQIHVSGGEFNVAANLADCFRMKAAKAAGAVVSLDLNFRGKLWQVSGGFEKAHQTMRRIVANVDVLVGNEEDLQKGLGLRGPEVESKHKLDPTAFFGMMDQVTKELPHVKIVATTLREVHSTNRHDWSAVTWVNGKTYQAPTCELDVLDRVGGGDGFAAGFFYGLLTGASPEDALRLGWAHGALLTTTPGDTTMV